MLLLQLTQLPLLALLASLAFAAPTKRAVTSDGASVNRQTYDYIVVGGGLTGVVVARRLADAQKTVLLVEAGGDEEGNTAVTDASKYTQAFDTALDYAFQTTPQTNGGGKTVKVRAGKGLGGSTLINGLAWTKPHKFQLDDLETLGNQGVNWDALAPLMTGAESWNPPSSEQLAAGVTYSQQCHGTSGPIGVSIDPRVPQAFEQTFNATGASFMTYESDLTCGDPGGLGPVFHSQQGNRRSDAYYGYLYQRNTPTLTILTNARVGRVTWYNIGRGIPPTATGIEFRDRTGATYTATAGKEVILAAGAISTPLILQQSGVGPRAWTDAVGITSVVELPVGQNLIDQTMSSTSFQFNSQSSGGGQSILFPRFADVFSGNDADATRLRTLLQNNLDQWAQDAANAGATGSAAGLKKVLALQRDWILNDGAAIGEAFDWMGGGVVNYDTWFLLPFGRGFVRVSSSDPYSDSFTLDPRFFSNEFDSLATAATLRFTRTYSRKAPLGSLVTNENKPGSGTGDSLENWLAFAKSDYRSNWHPVGTAAMLPLADGGVVDASHKVYNTVNLRVVDASVLPFQVSSHLMSVLYGLAERAAKVILEESNQC